MDTSKVISTFYGEGTPLERILLEHSSRVAAKALSIIDAKSLPVDRQFVHDAAMLHDIGIVMCDAPGIECHGKEPYIRHGLCGGQLLRGNAHRWGLSTADIEPYARVCERHTGAGLSRADIETQHLPLPVADLLPETLEEKLICYADKFFSKTRLDKEKTVEQVTHSMLKFGSGSVERFRLLHELFG